MYLVIVFTHMVKKLKQPYLYKKPYLRAKYTGANIEEDNSVRTQYRMKYLKDQTSIREAAPKNYVDNLFNDPSIIKK